MTTTGTRAQEAFFFGEPPVILYGDPQRVSGHLELNNLSEEDLPLSTISIIDSDVRGSSGTVLEEIYVARTIPGSGSVKIPVRLKLHSTTPPGEYRQTLSIGSSRKELIIKVNELKQIKIQPSQLSLEGEPNARITKTLLMSNLGNIDLSINRLGAVILEDESAFCRSLQTSLRSKAQEGYQPFLDALVAELAEARVDMLRVRVADREMAIPAGETSEVTLEFQLPGDLKPGRNYLGSLTVHNKTIGIQVTGLSGNVQP